jgi:hypothetical protein
MMRGSVVGDRKSVLVPYDPREAVSVRSAAKLAGRSQSTIRNWCEKFEIARKIADGNWQVSRVALRMLLDGDMDALAAYGAGDRTSPSVAAYFERCGLQNLLNQELSI